MIEMRWVERYVLVEEHYLQKVKVLQYRYPIPYLGADGNIHDSHRAGAIDWSDWIDVPTQEENQ